MQLIKGEKIITETSISKVSFYEISNEEIEEYNQIAREVLIPRGVRINELGEFARRTCEDQHRDWVHYNETGCSLLADEIIQFLESENLI